MSTRKKPSNFIQRLFKSIWRFFNAITKAFISWLLRSSLGQQRQRGSSQAGFVLPTVVMVILVVTLLTTAILFRSFDRSKNASNYRVNEVVLNAATPALDRSRAKLNRLFSSDETDLPGNTPADDEIAKVFETNEYTFGDETPLKLVFDLDGQNGIEENEKLRTAWKFPIDTDNNGKFDSFTLYGVYYRVPDTNRARGPLEARSRPQSTGAGDACLSGNGGGSDTSSPGWFPIDDQIKKAFFTYVATVPITQEQLADLASGYKPNDNTNIPVGRFEKYTGNKGFSALEMQQDQARLALDNNAVWYEDDLSITNVVDFKLNGRIQANANLMVGSKPGNITFFQVSSPFSCHYTAQNSKILVGGNISANGIAGTSSADTEDLGNARVYVHPFQEKDVAFNPGNFAGPEWQVSSNNKTTENSPQEVAYNTNAYAQRLNLLVTTALDLYTGDPRDVDAVATFGRFPTEIGDKFRAKYPDDGTALSEDEARNLLRQVIEVYFRERIRRVPFAEIPITQTDALGTVDATNVFPAGGVIKAPEQWMAVNNINDQPLELQTDKLQQTAGQSATDKENVIGDRILVGNGLPTYWLKDYATNTYAEAKEKQTGPNGPDTPNGRESQAKILDDLGDTSRNGFWEKAAASHTLIPESAELSGGLRIVTGAGIYIDGVAPQRGGTGLRIGEAKRRIGQFLGNERSFLPEPPVTPTQLQRLNAEINPSDPSQPVSVVWPDTMPMYRWDDRIPNNTYDRNEVFKGDLQMRATVVYHYASGEPDQPIACISSYYDPTNANTAKNSDAVDTTANGDPLGVSNNGLNYQVPTTTRDIDDTLRRQAYMVFPDGRWVNKPLKAAVEASDAGTALSFEHKAAIDAAKCALDILNGATPITGEVPDYAIRERAFLDARQVKTLHKPDVEFDANGITFGTGTVEAIDRQTFQIDPDDGKVLIADPEQVKIATQATLQAPVNTKNPTPSEYSLPIEERQPLEIRVTEIDLNVLRKTIFGTIPADKPKAGDPEYLLPLSGIIYATRDDALPDITDVNITDPSLTDGGSSATDFKVDPSRRPNGIRIWSSDPTGGGRLSRGDNNLDSAEEKGLILASNLPIYIKGNFNLHYEFDTQTAVEEFTETLPLPTAGTYDTAFYARRTPNPNFACRVNSSDECDPGDQWRPARILSDAITLLSNNFRDGFRAEGNYDFNNNAGNLAVASRLKNGFWWNGFGTNYLYTNGGTVETYPIDAEFPEQDAVNPAAEIEGSSYVMNGVTPIQRRVEFPAYKMEICTKLPISECGPTDWVKSPAAGTTATLPTSPEFTKRDYPRRVAFERDPDYGQLVLASDANRTAQPLRPNGNAIPYGTGAASAPPAEADNALWFWTTTDNRDPSAGISYNKQNLLYYLPDDPETVDTERQMLLPGTPRFPTELEPRGINNAFTGLSLLNGTNATADGDPSDYSVCIRAGRSQAYKVSSFAGGSCPTSLRRPINNMWRSLSTRVTGNIPDALDPNVDKVTVRVLDTTASPIEIEADAKVNFLDLSTPTLTGKVTLSRGAQSDPIFVIRGGSSITPMTLNEVELTLDGVDPNSIFWVPNRHLVITSTPGTAKLAGNFIGPNNGRIQITGAGSIKGGRILGFGSPNSTMTGEMIALTSTAQPLLVPVLQLHSGEGLPGDSLTDVFRKSADDQRKWLQKATSTDYNAVLVMGDTPSRPYTTGGGENNGGLHNFPRFLENWTGSATNPIIARIRGSLIQYIKSKYATGPFDTVDLVDQDNSLFFDSAAGSPPDYITGANPTDVDNIFGYQYPEAAAKRKAPFYQPPVRAWGYDVGLLTQTPDLFSRRIAIPEAGTPNEFFREVSRDDAWIQTLLCAAEETGNGYEWAIADESQRPSSCPPLGEYDD